MLHEVAQTIKNLLVEKGNLNSNEVDIAFDLPTREWQAKTSRPTINLYLYDIRESDQYRNPTPWDTRKGPNNTAIRSRPEGRFDLTYRVTAFANEVEDELRLLDRALLILLQNPVIPDDVRDDTLKGKSLPTIIAHPPSFVQSPADYWGAMDNEIRPSIDYRVTATLDLSQEIEVGVALTASFIVEDKDEVVVSASRNGENGADNKRSLASSEKLAMMPTHIGGTLFERGDGDEEDALPIVGASVELVERGLEVETDDQGRYRFRRVPPGDYTLRAKLPGDDREFNQAITVPAGNYDMTID